MEVALHFVQRDAEVLDAVADAIGALAGFAVWGLVRGFERTSPR